LSAEAARSRDRVSRDLRALRYELDFPRKLKRSFQRQTVLWITAAVVVGTLLVVLPARKKKVYLEAKGRPSKRSSKNVLEAGFALGVLRFAATLLKPVIVSFVTRKLRGYGNRPSGRAKW
jgi:hypothetical protein